MVFKNNQIIMNIPFDFAPNRLIEIGLTGINQSGAININTGGNAILYISSESIEKIRFQTSWVTK